MSRFVLRNYVAIYSQPFRLAVFFYTQKERGMAPPRLTDKVREGLRIIVARSATVWSAELGGDHWDKKEREMVLAASRYADHHFKVTDEDKQEREAD